MNEGSLMIDMVGTRHVSQRQDHFEELPCKFVNHIIFLLQLFLQLFTILT